MLNYEKVRNYQSDDIRHTYTARDAMLYALGVGMGQDQLDREELRYVYERDLRVLPSMARCWPRPACGCATFRALASTTCAWCTASSR